MDVYSFLVTTFNHFIGLFPAPLQWLVTVLVLIGLAGALISLVKEHFIFIILVIILLPFVVPVMIHLGGEVVSFLVYLVRVLKLTAPTS